MVHEDPGLAYDPLGLASYIVKAREERAGAAAAAARRWAAAAPPQESSADSVAPRQ